MCVRSSTHSDFVSYCALCGIAEGVSSFVMQELQEPSVSQDFLRSDIARVLMNFPILKGTHQIQLSECSSCPSGYFIEVIASNAWSSHECAKSSKLSRELGPRIAVSREEERDGKYFWVTYFKDESGLIRRTNTVGTQALDVNHH